MKTILHRAGALVFAFTIGCGVFLMYQKCGLSWLSQDPLSYCEVARNGDWYHDSNIRVHARVIFGSGGMYVFEDCDPVEALAATVELEGTDPTTGFNYVNEVLVSGNHEEVKTAEAIIEGRFNAKASTGCWRPKYNIKATKIELVSPVVDYRPQSSDGPALRTKH